MRKKIFVRILLILLVFALTAISCTTTSVSSDPEEVQEPEQPVDTTGVIGPFSYTAHHGSGAVTIDNFSLGSETEYTIPSEIEGYPVTAIGKKAFIDKAGLEMMILPETLVTIGEESFSGCKNLKQITIPESVTTIGKGAFFGCESLESFFIPAGLTDLSDEYVFYECTGLKRIEVADGHPGLISVDGILFSKDMSSLLMFPAARDDTSYIIPDGVTYIGNDAFSSCSNLNTILIPETVTEIGEWAFYGCTGLSMITLPDSIESIGPHAFRDCMGLMSMIIPESITEIGAGFFHNCTSLMSVTIPDSITTIGSYAFSHCSSLLFVELPASVTTLGNNAFDGCDVLSRVISAAEGTSEGWALNWRGDSGVPIYWRDDSQTRELIESYVKDAFHLYEESLYEEAIPIARKALYLSPGMSPEQEIVMTSVMAYGLILLEDYEDALPYADTVIELLIEHDWFQDIVPIDGLYSQRGFIYAKMGEIDKALEDYRIYFEKYPEDLESLKELAGLFLEAGETEGVLGVMDLLLENSTDRVLAYHSRIEYLDSIGWYEQVIDDIDVLLEIGTEPDFYYYNRAYYLSKMERYDTALDDINKAMELAAQPHPDDYYLRGSIYRSMGDPASAILDFEQVLYLYELYDSPVDTKIYGILGDLYHQQSDLVGAMEQYASYMAYTPYEDMEAEYLLAIGEISVEMGLYDNALSMYTSTVLLFPDHAETYLKAGEVYTLTERYQDALDAYSYYLELVGDDPDYAELRTSVEKMIVELKELL